MSLSEGRLTGFDGVSTSGPSRASGRSPGARACSTPPTGNGTLDQQRLYQLVREPGKIVDRTFEITFLSPGVEAYAFTFG